jgi:single-strand DNA-binding protein
MAGFQKLIALGNVTKDPEIKQVGENEVAKFSIAVNGYKDSVEFFDCEWWKPNGALGYVSKGTPVLIEGELQTQRWEKDGQQRSKMVVKVRGIQLVGGKPKAEPAFAGDFA